MNDQILANRRRAARLVAVFVLSTIVLAALVGLLLGALIGSGVLALLVGALIGLAVAVVTVAVALRRGTELVLRVSRARPVDAVEQPRLHNLVDGLCTTVGLDPPSIHVVDDAAPNAFVAATSPRESALVVTTGMLVGLELIELEGVVAHLVARIRGHEARTSTLAVLLAAGPVLVTDLMCRTRWWNGGREPRNGDPEPGGSPIGAVGAFLAPVTATLGPLVRWAAPMSRIMQADAGACQLTRYPPGLAAALAAIDRDVTVTHAATSATAHLWFAQPLSGLGDDGRSAATHRPFDTHPPLDERITLVREL